MGEEKSKGANKIRVTLVRGRAGKNKSILRTLDCLKLRKRGATAEFESSESVLGMVRKVAHLVKVEEIKDA